MLASTHYDPTLCKNYNSKRGCRSKTCRFSHVQLSRVCKYYGNREECPYKVCRFEHVRLKSLPSIGVITSACAELGAVDSVSLTPDNIPDLFSYSVQKTFEAPILILKTQSCGDWCNYHEQEISTSDLKTFHINIETSMSGYEEEGPMSDIETIADPLKAMLFISNLGFLPFHQLCDMILQGWQRLEQSDNPEHFRPLIFRYDMD
jgi:hypothetical protein